MPPVVVDSRPVAALVLADGTIFRGRSIGAAGETLGEVVFNTAMTGYQEILTDPSYAGQIVTLTYPHIGNTGVNDEDVESVRVHAAGLVIRDLPLRASNFRAQSDLASYLKQQGVVGIADIDTRKLTRRLREGGAQAGCIVAADATRHLGGESRRTCVAARALVCGHGGPGPGESGQRQAPVRVGRGQLAADACRRYAGFRSARHGSLPCRRLRLRGQTEYFASDGRSRLPHLDRSCPNQCE